MRATQDTNKLPFKDVIVFSLSLSFYLFIINKHTSIQDKHASRINYEYALFKTKLKINKKIYLYQVDSK